MQYGLRDEYFNYNHEMEGVEDSCEGEEIMDEDVFVWILVWISWRGSLNLKAKEGYICGSGQI